MSNSEVTDLPEWNALKLQQQRLSSVHMQNLFADDPQRFEHFHAQMNGLLLDYSKHKIDQNTFDALMGLAKARDFEKRRDDLFSGAAVNSSENRPALHMALRGSCAVDLNVNGERINDYVENIHHQIEHISAAIRKNPNITDVVNIGIGGSDLGPRMVHKALRAQADGPNIFFLSNVDGSAVQHRLKNLKPENTLFIIASKTFSTHETLQNAQTARAWLLEHIGEQELDEHLIAVTSNADAAISFGIKKTHILDMREWIGGRYSLWGPMGLSVAIAFGFDVFKAFLAGGHAMDEHFKTAPLTQNIPVIMAMLGIWYRNFWNYPTHAILPYSHDLREFPIFMQQLDMESNGKSVSYDGQPLDAPSGPIVFGESGTNAQHTFMQLLHQSTDIIPSDFILAAKPQHTLASHHQKLVGHALAQSKSLMEGQENKDEPHRAFPGNRPSSTIILNTLDAHHLGMLVALYEHKIFVQGAIWGINSFDQWGVELGKKHACDIINSLENVETDDDFDASTQGLLRYLAPYS